MAYLSVQRPCAACNFLSSECTNDCVFAPHFPPDQPEKFAYIYNAFDVNNICKLLNGIDISRRNEAVDTLIFEARAHILDPVRGLVAIVDALKETIQHLKNQISLSQISLSKSPNNPVQSSPLAQSRL
ncbi:LOB domain-containing protein 6 [Acorus gramineus]|uniref:LOB domain-containing protein 6 n=1 Tax=Acorus gramineus TaxID=55184 RepID=A0AAV9B028_ACOGR|nr:LOB domain-containing protein 6 [Acorus gramineus]